MSYKKTPVIERLWSKVHISDPTSCWLFLGAKTARGYGKIGLDNKTLLTHRVVYCDVYGDLLDDDVVLHRCDNPSCCNPTHLFKGTLSDNTQDMIAKGRHFTPWRGEPANHSKLTAEQVREIRASKLGSRRLCRVYGVSRGTIASVKRGKTWRHIL